MRRRAKGLWTAELSVWQWLITSREAWTILCRLMTSAFCSGGRTKEKWPQRTNSGRACFLENCPLALFGSPYKETRSPQLFQTPQKGRLIKISCRWNSAPCLSGGPLEGHTGQEWLHPSLRALWRKRKVVTLIIWTQLFASDGVLGGGSHGLGESWKGSGKDGEAPTPYLLLVLPVAPAWPVLSLEVTLRARSFPGICPECHTVGAGPLPWCHQ